MDKGRKGSQKVAAGSGLAAAAKIAGGSSSSGGAADSSKTSSNRSPGVTSNGGGSSGGNNSRSGPEANPFEEEEWDEYPNDALVDNGEPGVPVKALYDYEGAEMDELSFKKGFFIVIIIIVI